MTNLLEPKTLTKHKVGEVIQRVLDGDTLKTALKSVGISQQYFHELLQSDKASAVAYARAVELRADNLADEALQIADNEPDAAKARNQIQVRQWLASKLYAKRYGDRIDLNVTQTLDIGSTLAEARARLLPVRDQRNIIDVEVIEKSTGYETSPSDKETEAPAQNSEPDIFS